MRKGEENSTEQPRAQVFERHLCMSQLSEWLRDPELDVQTSSPSCALSHWEGELLGLEQCNRHFTSLRYTNQSKGWMYRTWLTPSPKIWKHKRRQTPAATDVPAAPWLFWSIRSQRQTSALEKSLYQRSKHRWWLTSSCEENLKKKPEKKKEKKQLKGLQH